MALAAFRLIDDDGNNLRFQADLGTNAWFRWAVGDREQVTNAHGVAVLAAPVHTSPLLGPVPRTMMGRTTFEVPRQLVSRTARYLQLMTFKAEDRSGPAISEVVALPLAGPPTTISDRAQLPDIALPARPFALAAQLPPSRIPMQTHVEPFSFVERPVMSQAMFFGAITGLLNSVLPKVAPLIGQIGPVLGKLLGGAGGGAGGEAKKLSDEDLAKAITELVKLIGTAGKDPAKAQALGHALRASCRELDQQAKGVSAGGHSQAMFWQMLLNPETLKAAGEAVKGLLEVADKSDQAFKQHMRDLIKGVDDPGLDKLLEGMSVQASAVAGEVKFKLDERTRVMLTTPTPTLAGRPRPVYRHGADLALSVTVETPKPVQNATLLVAVKTLDTHEPVARRAIKVANVPGGPLGVPVVLPRAALGKLAPGTEALLCLTLVWGERGARRGAGTEQRFTVAGELVFDRIEESGDLIALSDTEKYRAFWHKAWQETLDQETRSFEIDTKYYVRLDPQRTENGRIETLIQTEKGALWKHSGRMKTGMLLSLPGLNAAGQALGAPALSQHELEALRGQELVTRISLAARQKIDLGGRPGDSVALWVYPEVKLQKLVFQRAKDVEGGWIKSFEEHATRCVVPALLHFVGVTSAHDAASSAPLLNGMKVVFDHKVALYPVNLKSEKRQVGNGRAAKYN